MQQAARQVERRRILAPVSGRVVQIFRQPGEWVEPGQPIARVLRIDRLEGRRFAGRRTLGGDPTGRAVRLQVESAAAGTGRVSGPRDIRAFRSQPGERAIGFLGRNRKSRPATASRLAGFAQDPGQGRQPRLEPSRAKDRRRTVVAANRGTRNVGQRNVRIENSPAEHSLAHCGGSGLRRTEFNFRGEERFHTAGRLAAKIDFCTSEPLGSGLWPRQPQRKRTPTFSRTPRPGRSPRIPRRNRGAGRSAARTVPPEMSLTTCGRLRRRRPSLVVGPLRHAELDLVDVLGQQHVAELHRTGDSQAAGQVPVQRQLQVDPFLAALMGLFRRLRRIGRLVVQDRPLARFAMDVDAVDAPAQDHRLAVDVQDRVGVLPSLALGALDRPAGRRPLGLLVGKAVQTQPQAAPTGLARTPACAGRIGLPSHGPAVRANAGESPPGPSNRGRDRGRTAATPRGPASRTVRRPTPRRHRRWTAA